MTSVRFPEQLDARLAALAAATRRSKSYYIKEAVAYYLDDVADAEIALERMRKPNPVYYTTEELLKNLRAREKVKQPQKTKRR